MRQRRRTEARPQRPGAASGYSFGQPLAATASTLYQGVAL